ncbi:hypothetical protein [Metabacillus sp. cB07]|uniref:phage lytic cycle repressor MrpR family protein n=1 Tax=Metabacillus sp. cB07 TaxID=2806989 RepID=UPI0019395769|nr:hypothetical protein [Metabacillus sp. cB07]
MQIDKFYNSELKNKFLMNFPTDTKSTYSTVFRKTAKHEGFVEKDLNQFSLMQLEKLMQMLNFNTINGAKTYGRVISSYLNWSIDEGLRTEVNPLKEVGGEWFEKFVNEITPFLSEEDIIQIENDLVNYQDKAIVRLLFEGINGYEHSEILNLRSGDINKNTMHLNDNKFTKRSIQVSDRAIDIALKAAKEEIYLNRNGQSSGRRSEAPLVSNDYVIKSTLSRGTINTNAANKHLIYRRISTISELFELPYLSPKNIEKSGRIKMANDLLLSEGNLDKPQLDKIIEQFAITSTILNGKEYHMYSALTTYINTENIQLLYPK